MIPTEAENRQRLVVRWITTDKTLIERIRQRFHIPLYTTVNGYSPVEVSDADLPVLEETARRGFISIHRHLKWCKNGVDFAFKYRN